ncbi:hypothetical protein LINPERHAP1_LOCUS19248 [Linum perenne]
MDILVQRLK